MFGKIEHIGIAVSDLGKAETLFTALLGTQPYKRETVESEKVVTSFFRSGPNKVELLQSLSSEGPIGKFITQRGEGIHHIAFEVADIRKEMERLRAEGFKVLQEEPLEGADNKWVCFLHPKSAGGVLVELCQERNPQI